MWRSRLIALYCVNWSKRRNSLFRQFESVKSMMRYRPPKGTAGFARSRVSGSSRVPLPPARMTANTFFMMDSARATIREWRRLRWSDFNRRSEGERGAGGGEDRGQRSEVRSDLVVGLQI